MLHLKLFYVIISDLCKDIWKNIKNFSIQKYSIIKTYYLTNKVRVVRELIICNSIFLLVNIGSCMFCNISIKNNTVIESPQGISSQGLLDAFLFRTILYDDKVSWKIIKVPPKEFNSVFLRILPEVRVFSKISAHTNIFGKVIEYTFAFPEFNDGYGFLPSSEQERILAAAAKDKTEKEKKP